MVQACRPAIGIIALLANPSPETVLTLVRHGLHGLLSEDASERDLECALRAAAAGNSFNCRRIRELLATSASAVESAANNLTRQELCVLRLLMQGESNRGIARKLTVREKTVEAHLTHIYNKLKVNSRVEAILRAQELNLLEPDIAHPQLKIIGKSGDEERACGFSAS
ncbi:MAG TPA: response regulator transcription factor [Ktedonobacteraceae bacterium]|nr:response regulator transcription factor [Ktedonobacteraceae bacterium]